LVSFQDEGKKKLVTRVLHVDVRGMGCGVGGGWARRGGGGRERERESERKDENRERRGQDKRFQQRLSTTWPQSVT